MDLEALIILRFLDQTNLLRNIFLNRTSRINSKHPFNKTTRCWIKSKSLSIFLIGQNHASPVKKIRNAISIIVYVIEYITRVSIFEESISVLWGSSRIKILLLLYPNISSYSKFSNKGIFFKLFVKTILTIRICKRHEKILAINDRFTESCQKGWTSKRSPNKANVEFHINMYRRLSSSKYTVLLQQNPGSFLLAKQLHLCW